MVSTKGEQQCDVQHYEVGCNFSQNQKIIEIAMKR